MAFFNNKSVPVLRERGKVQRKTQKERPNFTGNKSPSNACLAEFIPNKLHQQQEPQKEGGISHQKDGVELSLALRTQCHEEE